MCSLFHTCKTEPHWSVRCSMAYSVSPPPVQKILNGTFLTNNNDKKFQHFNFLNVIELYSIHFHQTKHFLNYYGDIFKSFFFKGGGRGWHNFNESICLP